MQSPSFFSFFSSFFFSFRKRKTISPAGASLSLLCFSFLFFALKYQRSPSTWRPGTALCLMISKQATFLYYKHLHCACESNVCVHLCRRWVGKYECLFAHFYFRHANVGVFYLRVKCNYTWRNETRLRSYLLTTCLPSVR